MPGLCVIKLSGERHTCITESSPLASAAADTGTGVVNAPHATQHNQGVMSTPAQSTQYPPSTAPGNYASIRTEILQGSPHPTPSASIHTVQHSQMSQYAADLQRQQLFPHIQHPSQTMSPLTTSTLPVHMMPLPNCASNFPTMRHHMQQNQLMPLYPVPSLAPYQPLAMPPMIVQSLPGNIILQNSQPHQQPTPIYMQPQLPIDNISATVTTGYMPSGAVTENATHTIHQSQPLAPIASSVPQTPQVLPTTAVRPIDPYNSVSSERSALPDVTTDVPAHFRALETPPCMVSVLTGKSQEKHRANVGKTTAKNQMLHSHIGLTTVATNEPPLSQQARLPEKLCSTHHVASTEYPHVESEPTLIFQAPDTNTVVTVDIDNDSVVSATSYTMEHSPDPSTSGCTAQRPGTQVYQAASETRVSLPSDDSLVFPDIDVATNVTIDGEIDGDAFLGNDMFLFSHII